MISLFFYGIFTSVCRRLMGNITMWDFAVQQKIDSKFGYKYTLINWDREYFKAVTCVTEKYPLVRYNRINHGRQV